MDNYILEFELKDADGFLKLLESVIESRKNTH